MARGPHLKEVKLKIAEIHNANPDWGPKQVHAELQKELRQQGLHKTYGSDWPSVSSVGKELTKIRDRIGQHPQEEPWSMATLDKYPIAPETIPVVLEMSRARFYRSIREPVTGAKPEDKSKEGSLLAIHPTVPLTIREAKWVARLCTVITDPTLLESVSFQYSRIELLREMLDRPNDTRPMDFTLTKLDRDEDARETLDRLFHRFYQLPFRGNTGDEGVPETRQKGGAE